MVKGAPIPGPSFLFLTSSDYGSSCAVPQVHLLIILYIFISSVTVNNCVLGEHSITKPFWDTKTFLFHAIRCEA